MNQFLIIALHHVALNLSLSLNTDKMDFFLFFLPSHLSIFLSQRGQEPGTDGPQRSVRPLREAQTDPRSSQWE